MTVSRRVMFARLFLAGLVAALLQTPARADTAQYVYDAHGRLVRVTYSNGVVVDYSYDNAGNRTQVVRTTSPPPPPPSTFTQTIAIIGAGPVNLRSLADAVGYNGAQNANVTYTLASGVSITGIAGNANAPNGAIALDTGTWPTGTYAISLAIQITGNVHGGGGVGGAGGVSTGGAGGDSIYCRLPISITVNAGGAVRGGGGGGGGGASDEITVGGEPIQVGGGGGGGGFPNGPGGTGGLPAGSPGSAGTTSSGGAGGAGSGAGSTAGGAGGGGGSAGQSGVTPGLAGGGAGFAIRKNGHTVTVTNNGTIIGTVG